MNIDETCINRIIRKHRINTPLLVPSFSSVIYGIHENGAGEKINDLYELHRPQLTKTLLVSAFDIHNNFIKKDVFTLPEVVFIDSGKYELDVYEKAGKSYDWTFENHFSVIEELDPVSNVILVNYDQKISLSEQFKNADELFSKFNNYGSCFLYKPNSPEIRYVNVSEFLEHVDELDRYDIIGFAEKELGDSILVRCKNILKIREKMNNERLNNPIQLFGCIDPLSIIIYFIFGIDIFDGLSWIKYAFSDNNLIYINNFIIYNQSWSEPFSTAQYSTRVNNLSELNRLRGKLIRFTRSHDLNVFELDESIIINIKKISEEAGLSLGD